MAFGRVEFHSSPLFLGRLVKRIQQALDFQVGEFANIAQRTRKLQLAVIMAAQASAQLYTQPAQAIQVKRAPFRRAHQLGEGRLHAAHDIFDLVVAFVENATGLHPADKIAPAAGCESGREYGIHTARLNAIHMITNRTRNVLGRITDYTVMKFAAGG